MDKRRILKTFSVLRPYVTQPGQPSDTYGVCSIDAEVS